MASAEVVEGAASASGDAAGSVDADLIPIELAWSAAPQQWQRLQLRLPAGSTALTALRASGLSERLGASTLDGLTLALWGRAIDQATVLQPHDRLELLRPLVVDPKEARRLRYRRDGLRPRRKSPRR